MTKADILGIFDTLEVCTHYNINQKDFHQLPYEICSMKISPVYERLNGWRSSLTGINRFEDLPGALKQYITYIEKQTGVPVSMISTGPDREQHIRK